MNKKKRQHSRLINKGGKKTRPQVNEQEKTSLKVNKQEKKDKTSG